VPAARRSSSSASPVPAPARGGRTAHSERSLRPLTACLPAGWMNRDQKRGAARRPRGEMPTRRPCAGVVRDAQSGRGSPELSPLARRPLALARGPFRKTIGEAPRRGRAPFAVPRRKCARRGPARDGARLLGRQVREHPGPTAKDVWPSRPRPPSRPVRCLLRPAAASSERQPLGVRPTPSSDAPVPPPPIPPVRAGASPADAGGIPLPMDALSASHLRGPHPAQTALSETHRVVPRRSGLRCRCLSRPERRAAGGSLRCTS
jgi:hypothetical protein